MDYTKDMNINQIYLWSRQIHKLIMWICIVTGVPMALTGLLLDDGGNSTIRLVHRLLSKPFAISLAGLMVTGVVMWGVPVLLKRSRK